jgi:hypothetical protein
MASQPFAEISFMEQLGEIGQRVQMLSELALRHENSITKLTGLPWTTLKGNAEILKAEIGNSILRCRVPSLFNPRHSRHSRFLRDATGLCFLRLSAATCKSNGLVVTSVWEPSLCVFHPARCGAIPSAQPE